MPLDASAFPEEVQVAFFIFGMLPDRWDGMSGLYMGKDWSSADFLYRLYEIEYPKEVTYFAKLYESIIINHKAEEQEKRRKQEAQKAKSGGKQYTHNVQR